MPLPDPVQEDEEEVEDVATTTVGGTSTLGGDSYEDDAFEDTTEVPAAATNGGVSNLSTTSSKPPPTASKPAAAAPMRSAPSPDPKAAPPAGGSSASYQEESLGDSFLDDDTATNTAPSAAGGGGQAVRSQVDHEEEEVVQDDDDYSQDEDFGSSGPASAAAAPPPSSKPPPSTAAKPPKPHGRSSVVSGSYAESFDSDNTAPTIVSQKQQQQQVAAARGSASSARPSNPAPYDSSEVESASASALGESGDRHHHAQQHRNGGGVAQPQSARPRSSARTRPQSAAPAAKDPLDDSWEGDIRILPPGSSQDASGSQQGQGSRPPSRPSSAGSHRSAGASSFRSSVYTGSLAGSLVAPPPALPASRQRPSSAAPRDRQAAQLSDLTSRHPATWDVRDVAMWVEYIGMGQYRKKFSHNCIDGRLLLAITDQQLKVELGIGPLGHRAALLQAVAALAEEAEDMEPAGGSPPARGGARGGAPRAASAGVRPRPASARAPPANAGKPSKDDPRRPASASKAGIIPPDPYLGPALGKVTVYEQRAKLLFELDRAAARAAQHRSLVEQLQQTHAMSESEVAHLRGLLQDLERKNKTAVGNAVGGLDAQARIPWRPNGWGTSNMNRNPERFGKPGEDPSVDMTFAPKLSPASKRILRENYGSGGSPGGGGSGFLDRLETDARKRERNKLETDKKYYSQEALFQDPMLAKRKAQKDWQFVAKYFQEKSITEEQLSDREEVYETQVNDAVEHYAEEWRLKDSVVRSILNAKGSKKVSALAGALRTMLFMQRYESELQGRDMRLRELQNRWWESAMGRPKAQKEQEDMAQSVQYFALLGWRGDDAVTDERMDALLRRVAAYKAAYEKWRDQQASGAAPDANPTVDWNSPPWSSDSLGALQESAMAEMAQSLEAGGAAAAAGGAGKVAKTPLAPAGSVTVGPAADGGMDYLTYTVRLLARARQDDLGKLGKLSGSGKQLALYRHIRTQKFIEFTESEIKNKERKLREAYESLQKPKRVISREEMDGFFERLLDDAGKRRSAQEKLMNDKLSKEQEILKSSAMYSARPRSAR